MTLKEAVLKSFDDFIRNGDSRVKCIKQDGGAYSYYHKNGRMPIFVHATKASAAFLCQQKGDQLCHGIGCNIFPKCLIKLIGEINLDLYMRIEPSQLGYAPSFSEYL